MSSFATVGYGFIVLLSLFVAVSLVVMRSESVSADAPNLSTDERCEVLKNTDGNSFGENGVIDYIWMTPASGNRYIVKPGATSIRVKVIGEMSLCATHATRKGVGYISTTSQRSDNIHSVDSETDPEVADNGRLSPDGNLDYGKVTKKNGERVTVHREIGATLNIENWAAGSHRVCIVSNTWTSVNTQWYKAGAPACQTINLEYAWTINGQSYVHKTGQSDPNFQKSVTASVGQTVYWTHDMRAENGDMDREVSYRIDKSYSSNPAPSAMGRGTNGELFMKWTGDSNYQPGVYSYSQQLRRSITQSDVGAGDKFNGTWLHAPALCQNVSWKDGAYDNPNRLESGSACVTVPYNFNLRPSVSGFDVDKVIEQDGVIASVNGVITNDGPTKSYPGVRWQLSRFIIKAGGPLPGGTDNKQDGCAYYRNIDCSTTEGSGSGASDSSFGVNPKDTTVRTLTNQPMGDLEVGDRVCYGMSVMAYKRDLDNNSGNWRHSAARCAIIGKKPKVQVWGSDLSVGRYFANDSSPRVSAIVDTSVSTKAGGTKTFGSWIEYGIFASGTVRSASAAGLAGPDGNSSSSQGEWDKLTFANAGHTSASGCNGTIKFGCYTVPAGTGTIPDVAARLAPTATTGTPLAGTVSLDGRSGSFYANGNLTISGGTINKSNSVIIRASGTVTISGDIRYTTDSLSSLSEIPQVVIIANDIRINDNVTNVDAWLIANGPNGRIYTCGNNNFSQILTSNTCKEKLTINGPVMAKKLYLTRTSGSGAASASGEPAEVLNLRADAYLWAIGRSGGLGSVQTINTRELAPRF
jgi:adhesin HecA-like repeat protein